MDTQTSASSVVCFAVAALLGAVGQFLYKSGASAANSGWLSYLLNWQLAAGVAAYVGVMVLFVVAFKQGGSPAVLYPIYASTFIWSSLIAWRVEGQPITPGNVLGMVLIVAGMFFLAGKR